MPNRELDQAFDSACAGMRVIDEHGNMRRVNRALLAMAGRTRDQAAAQKCFEMFPTPLCRTSRCARERVLGGEELVEEVVETERGPGRGRRLLLRAVPLRGTNARVTGVIEHFADITDRKRAEQEIERLRAQLTRSEKLSAVGQLVAGVAHEINNPLATILVFAQGALRRAPEDHPLRKPLVSIERESQRCKRLVQALLACSRSSKGESVPLDLNDLVQEALDLAGSKAQLTSAEIRFDPAPGLPKVLGDRTRLEQMILNIASNALDAMPEGGLLRVSTGRRSPHRPGRRGEEVWVRLEDNGPGIPKESRERLFEPFFTTKETGKGTGLGLSIAHETVRRHGGVIEVESEPGKGSAFTVRLPAHRSREGGRSVVGEEVLEGRVQSG